MKANNRMGENIYVSNPQRSGIQSVWGIPTTEWEKDNPVGKWSREQVLQKEQTK